MLVAKVLRLPVKASDEQRWIAKLERDLERAGLAAKSSRRAAAETKRLQAALGAARAELAQAQHRSAQIGVACDCGGGRARRVVAAAVAALCAKPPAGLVAADVEAFAVRQGSDLVALVATALAGRT